MKRTIHVLFARLLRSRLGVAVAIALLIVLTVGSARLLRDPSSASLSTSVPARPITTVDPSSGNDGAISTAAPSNVYVSPGAASPGEVASAFIAAWLHRDSAPEEWREKLSAVCTSRLTKALADVDPASVPAQEAIEEPTLVLLSDNLIRATVQMDSGELRIEIVANSGTWLVDAIDWERP